MQKAVAIAFVRAYAMHDRKIHRIASSDEIKNALQGYARCKALFSDQNEMVHPATMSAAIETYRAERGVLSLANEASEIRSRRRVLTGISIDTKPPRWAGSLLRRKHRQRGSRRPALGRTA